MKRKGIEKESEKNRKGKKKSSKKLVTVVMAAIIVSAVMTAFISGAAAAGTVTNFTITPKAVSANTTSGYNVIVNTTGFENSLVINITLPKGFRVANDTMQSNDELARIDIYNTSGWFANVIFKANATNPKTEVKVEASDGSDTISTVKTVNYGPGVANKTTITAEYGSTNLNAEMVLPTATVNGSVNASITLPTGQNITNVSISIKPFVTSPETVGNYTFVAKVNGQEKTSTVKVEAGRAVVLVYNANNLGYNFIAWTGSVDTSASALADTIIADAGAGVVPTGTTIAYYNTTDGLWHGFLVGINAPGSIYDFAIPQYGVIGIKVSAEGTFQMPLP